MSWQSSVARALRDLKAEEARLAGELDELRQRIASLGGIASSSSSSSSGGAKTKGKRRTLSPAARAAISRAAKKRWAKYRAAQGNS
jgi:cell division septum initiation protein DivIVA